MDPYANYEQVEAVLVDVIVQGELALMGAEEVSREFVLDADDNLRVDVRAYIPVAPKEINITITISTTDEDANTLAS